MCFSSLSDCVCDYLFILKWRRLDAKQISAPCWEIKSYRIVSYRVLAQFGAQLSRAPKSPLNPAYCHTVYATKIKRCIYSTISGAHSEASAPAEFLQPEPCTHNPALCRSSWLLSPWGAHHVSSSAERGRGQRSASHRHVALAARVRGRLGSRWAANLSVTGAGAELSSSSWVLDTLILWFHPVFPPRL